MTTRWGVWYSTVAPGECVEGWVYYEVHASTRAPRRE
jgi:hypothetical protein